MKCAQCGADNSSKSNFCNNCGARLSTALFCTHCGKELPQKGKFCIYCGTKVKAGGSAPVRTSRKVDRGKYPKPRAGTRGRRSAGGRATNSKILGYSLLAIIILGIVGYLLWSLPRRTSNLNTGSGTNLVWSTEVQKIAANFNCPCGQCGVARLDTCTCDIPGGANEAKNYIQYLLNQGLPGDIVIRKVEERYGNRI